MPCSSRSSGAYVASETAFVGWGHRSKPGNRGIVYLQGSHGVAGSIQGDPSLEHLVNSGFVIVNGDMGQTVSQGTFGNSTAQTRTGQLRTFVQGASSPIAAAAGKVHILGASGGATAALNYARANPTLVASIYGVCPVVALQDFYENRTDVALTQAEIRAAYGGDVPTYATHDPSASGNQTALSGIPLKLAYSTDDPYVPVATVTAYKALIEGAGGTCELVSLGAVGHTPTGLSAQDIADFFLAHP